MGFAGTFVDMVLYSFTKIEAVARCSWKAGDVASAAMWC